MPHLHAVEAILEEDVLSNMSVELAPFAVKEFMNLLGNELFTQAELDRLTHD